jgi:hypothetical protein
MSGIRGMRVQCTYVPAPGTYSALALEFLREQVDGKASSRALREAIGVKDGVSLTRYLNGAVKHGLLVCRPTGAGRVWALLGGPPDEPPDDLPPIQRIVNAHDAPLKYKPGPSSVFDLAETV